MGIMIDETAFQMDRAKEFADGLDVRLGSHLSMGPHAIDDEVLDLVHRIEGIHGTLRDHGDLLTPDAPHLTFADPNQLFLFEEETSRQFGIAGEEPEDSLSHGG